MHALSFSFFESKRPTHNTNLKKDLSTRSASRASSDDVDGFLTLRVDPLEEGHSTLREWPNRLAWNGASIPITCRGGRRIIPVEGEVKTASSPYLVASESFK
ncbi:hypothetical protein M9H77_26851 [Catharanthus roseus]|uniref:Uncharacterized protein n=1 Tax=Catharanthus roseus TaxID=4058 RepID=A0ACC0AF33_CATRO|nr:hypothetical protein M9H77_26851 [Catharanthus roseus]